MKTWLRWQSLSPFSRARMLQSGAPVLLQAGLLPVLAVRLPFLFSSTRKPQLAAGQVLSIWNQSAKMSAGEGSLISTHNITRNIVVALTGLDI